MTSILQMERCLHCTGECFQLERLQLPPQNQDWGSTYMVLLTSGLFHKVGSSWLSIKVGIRGCICCFSLLRDTECANI